MPSSQPKSKRVLCTALAQQPLLQALATGRQCGLPPPPCSTIGWLACLRSKSLLHICWLHPAESALQCCSASMNYNSAAGSQTKKFSPALSIVSTLDAAQSKAPVFTTSVQALKVFSRKGFIRVLTG